MERVLSCVAEGAGSVTLPAGIDARIEFGMLAFKAPAAREDLVADWVTVPGRLPLAGDVCSSQNRWPLSRDAISCAAPVSLQLPGK